jgi:hypothetical protein
VNTTPARFRYRFVVSMLVCPATAMSCGPLIPLAAMFVNAVCDGYGSPRSAVLEAELALGKKVQKYGRTSDVTKGTVTGINAQVLVGYDGGTALFVDQIIVEAKKPLIKAGDSGSLVVADPGRESVGLLFAGNKSGKFAIANEIGHVLTAFGVTIAGD